MTSRGLIDFYLPSKVAYHLKIILGGILVAMFFSTIWTGRPINQNFWYLFIAATVQLEIIMVIAIKLFDVKSIKSEKTYKQQILIKLIRFYLLVLLIAAVTVLATIAINLFFVEASFTDLLNQFVRQELRPLLVSWLIGITIGGFIFFYMEWNESLKREQKLREEKLIFQYETLKNQVNPHFLFNSLNTLSSLVSKDPSLAEKFIGKLSTIYRYILENRDVEYINLSKEIEFVQNYFYLQKIRDDGKIDLDLSLSDMEKFEILPISIQILVENALKHNAATREKPLIIKISREDDLVIVENNLQPKMKMETSSKLGLKNLMERIKLVMDKEVIIDQNSKSFKVKIPIKSI